MAIFCHPHVTFFSFWSQMFKPNLPWTLKCIIREVFLNPFIAIPQKFSLPLLLKTVFQNFNKVRRSVDPPLLPPESHILFEWLLKLNRNLSQSGITKHWTVRDFDICSRISAVLENNEIFFFFCYINQIGTKGSPFVPFFPDF